MADMSKESTKDRKIKIIKEKSKYGKERFFVVDSETGELLDDSQGYGYKSYNGARKAWFYKLKDNLSPEAKKEKQEKTEKIRQWLKDHPSFRSELSGIEWDLIQTPDIYHKNGLKVSDLTEVLKNQHLTIDFDPKELLIVYRKGKL